MKIAKFLSVTLAIVIFGLLFPGAAKADGIIIPDPPICDPGPCPPPPCPWPGECPPMPPVAQLAIKYHRVEVRIEDQVASTRVDQVFYNLNDWQVEGTYVFPIPVDAAVSAFTLWVDGEPVEGKVLDAGEARRTYEDIVRNLRDPALLEYADRGAVQARIFPIPSKGERRIELEYTQVLAAENGLVRYVYPLNTEKFSAWPLEEVSVSVDVRSKTPIRAIYSPSHEVDTERESDYQARVGYEATNVRPDTDFALVYSLGEEEAFHLLTFRDAEDPGNPDGFFLLLLAPRPGAADQVLPKDVLLVLDRSGSMEGEKFIQAQEALRFVLKHLNPEDRFNLVTFSTGSEVYARELRPAEEANEALAWVDRLSAVGSTDINRALLEAVDMVDGERPTYLIFLTDGLPTEGVIDSQEILDNLQDSAPGNLRLFAFGVGYDVDTYLLDSLAQAHHGTSSYVLPEERLDEKLSGFYEKISTPVLTDLELDFGDIPVYDLYPSPLPDLFSGAQIVLVGRYRQGGATTVTLSGEVDGEKRNYHFQDQSFVKDSSRRGEGMGEAIPRLWATRKIGYLLNQVRLEGPDQEIIDQIVKLSIRYGIVTPYTSYLVTEPMPLGAAEQERIAGEQFNQLQAMPTAMAYGQEAVEKSADQSAMAGAQAPAAPAQGAADSVRVVGARTFVLSEGVWIDTAFDPETMETVKVAFLSSDYFDLIEARPELGAGFALGERVIALAGGLAYEVVGEGVTAPPLDLPPSVTPSAGEPGQPTPAVTLSTQSQENKPQAPGGLPCLGGLLPLALLPLGGMAWMRRDR